MSFKSSNDTKDICSFEKGIINKLNENKDIVSLLMAQYIVANNSKWNSNDFPSSQIAKVILRLFKSQDISFPIIHRIVKEILKDWKNKNLCNYIMTTKYGHCRKTKDIYRFNSNGIKKLKEMLIHNDIKRIKNTLNNQDQNSHYKEIMKTRESIINEIRFDFEEILYDYVNSNELFNDE
ncbi:MAG: hypothetical protein ACTSPY_02615 [Candidatus Helarchaeota archaeon]